MWLSLCFGLALTELRPRRKLAEVEQKAPGEERTKGVGEPKTSQVPRKHTHHVCRNSRDGEGAGHRGTPRLPYHGKVQLPGCMGALPLSVGTLHPPTAHRRITLIRETGSQ